MLEGDADVHYWPGENIGEEYKLSDNNVNFVKVANGALGNEVDS